MAVNFATLPEANARRPRGAACFPPPRDRIALSGTVAVTRQIGGRLVDSFRIRPGKWIAALLVIEIVLIAKA